MCLLVPSLPPAKPVPFTGKAPEKKALTLIPPPHLTHLPTEKRGDEEEEEETPFSPEEGPGLNVRGDLAAPVIPLGC